MQNRVYLLTLVLLLILFLNIPAVFSGSLYQAVENKIENALRKDSTRWNFSEYKQNTVSIIDAQSIDDNKLVVKGTFNYDSIIGPGTIHFDATLKKVLDDVSVVKMEWVQPTGAIWCIGDCQYRP